MKSDEQKTLDEKEAHSIAGVGLRATERGDRPQPNPTQWALHSLKVVVVVGVRLRTSGGNQHVVI